MSEFKFTITIDYEAIENKYNIITSNISNNSVPEQITKLTELSSSKSKKIQIFLF